MMHTSFDNSSFIKILSFLKAHKSEFLSGQDMSDILKISRVSVWKDIKKIRSLGYKICLLYTSPSPRDPKTSRMPSSA